MDEKKVGELRKARQKALDMKQDDREKEAQRILDQLPEIPDSGTVAIVIPKKTTG